MFIAALVAIKAQASIKVETTQASIHRLMNKENMVHTRMKYYSTFKKRKFCNRNNREWKIRSCSVGYKVSVVLHK